MTRKNNLAWLTLLICSALVLYPVKPVAASNCQSSNKSGSVKLGSKVNGDLVTICASREWLKKILVAHPVIKPTAAPVVKKAPAAKAAPKPKPKTAVKPKTKNKKTGNTAVFRAMRPAATRSPMGVLAVGQPVVFQTRVATKVAKTTLLGQKVEVRFTPQRIEWDLGDGNLANGKKLSHAYSGRGTYVVKLKALFRVEYRAQGGSWFTEKQAIWLAAPALTVPVGVTEAEPSSGTVVLVSGP